MANGHLATDISAALMALIGRYEGATGLVTDVADGTDIRGAAGGAGTPTFASEAEGEAGTSTTLAINPAVLHAVLQHIEATRADIDAGTADRWVGADKLLVIRHALEALIRAKEDVTAQTVTTALLAAAGAMGVTLTEEQASSLRTWLGTLRPEGEWGAWQDIADPVGRTTLPAVLHASGIYLHPDDVDVQWGVNRGLRGAFTNVVSASTLRAFGARTPNTRADLDPSDRLQATLSDPSDPRDAPFVAYLALAAPLSDGRREFLWSSDLTIQPDATQDTFGVRTRSGDLEEFCQVSRPNAQVQVARIPKLPLDKLPDGLAPQVPSDWDATSGPARILNKPAIDVIPTSRTLPTSPAVGDRVRLLAPVTATQVGEAAWSALGTGELADGWRVVPGTGGVAGRIALVRPGTDTRVPTALIYRGTSYPVTHATDLPGGVGAPFRHYFVTASGAFTPTLGQVSGWNATFSDSTKWYPDLNIAANDLVVYDGFRWNEISEVNDAEDVREVIEAWEQDPNDVIPFAKMGVRRFTAAEWGALTTAQQSEIPIAFVRPS